MLEIKCTFCGLRDEREFVYGGPAAPPRPKDPDSMADAVWVDYLTVPKNPLGPVLEHWWHLRGCGEWVTVRRDTVTHEVTEGSREKQR